MNIKDIKDGEFYHDEVNKTLSYKLITPVEHGDETITVLTFRRPCAKDIKAVGALPISLNVEKMASSGENSIDIKADVMIKFLAVLSDQSPALIDKLDSYDTTVLIANLCILFTPPQK